ncbi:MAG: polysaccharide deacetylase family protein [Sphingobacterium sp.]|uniref:polysaccharide deacetylase family protein n=1 Tax=Sphingobacterium sp. JB170 TaxID=1434842 RepID=UPI00097F33CC|nr:polysaccharide deacetylase family protein [Sphingobacterium sp. JB170]SJN44314.1 Peptidoglycan N-acetylglucosamine deacetylase [Sphingobacterium sp. JB170]
MLKHVTLLPVYIAANGLALLAVFAGESYGWLLLSVLITLTIITIGSFDIRLGYFTDTYFKGKESQNKLIALSFDDGPSSYTPEILLLLEKFNARATFFCIGKQVHKYPQLSKEIIRQGHTIGNHTFSHLPHFGFMNARQVEQELRDCDRALLEVIGQRPCLFRPPYGVTNPSIARAVKATKHHVIGWSNRSLDTVITQDAKIYKRVVKKLRAGDIVLFHDTSVHTVEVVKRLLPTLKERGYTCVTIDKLLNLKAYED